MNKLMAKSQALDIQSRGQVQGVKIPFFISPAKAKFCQCHVVPRPVQRATLYLPFLNDIKKIKDILSWSSYKKKSREKYWEQLRLLKAIQAQLLPATLSYQEVAAATGYDDQKYHSLFKISSLQRKNLYFFRFRKKTSSITKK